MGEFKRHASRMIRELQGERPIIVTQNGRAAAVVISPAEFDRLRRARYHQDVVRSIERGLTAVDIGDVIDDEDLEHELDARFGPLDQ